MYRVYYDKQTNQILFLSNEESKEYFDFVVVSEEVYCDLISGREKTTNYTVGYLTAEDGQTSLALLPKTQQTYNFKNTMFEWVSDAPTPDTELTVVWNITKKQWEFSLSNSAIRRLSTTTDNSLLVFFVILEHDFDFLIRAIFVEPSAMFESKVHVVPFEQLIEENIKKISIATKLTMKSYGLKIYDKN